MEKAHYRLTEDHSELKSLSITVYGGRVVEVADASKGVSTDDLDLQVALNNSPEWEQVEDKRRKSTQQVSPPAADSAHTVEESSN